MGRCGCEMMIECEVQTGQTVEPIENTRREGGDGVVIQRFNGRWMRRFVERIEEKKKRDC